MAIERRGKNSWRVGVRVDTGTGWAWIRETLVLPAAMSEARQRKEAQKALAKLKIDVDEGRVKPVTAHHTVASFADLWLTNHVRPNLSPITLKNYQHFLDARILPALGDVPLKKLTPLLITDWLMKLREAPRLTTSLPDTELKGGRRPSDQLRHDRLSAQPAKPLSPRTVQHYYDTLSALLDKAVQWEILRRNPMAQVDRPVAKKVRVRYLDEAQAVRLLRCLKNEPNLSYRAAVLLALLCGLRLGEVGALKLSDIDWENATIDVTRALKYSPQTGNYQGDPKSAAGQRLISLPPDLMTVLHAARDYQQETATMIPDLWQGDGFIVHSWNGAQLHHDTPSKWFRKFADRNGFPGVRFHDLRHTHATILLANNMDVVEVSTRMGHGDASVTLKIYGHALRRRDEEAAQVMQSLSEAADAPEDPPTLS